MEMLIALSVLDYEPDLSNHIDNIAESESLSQIIRLIRTGKIHNVHIDVMRPPMIPHETKFSVKLIKRLYEELHKKIPLALHLMVKDPFPIIDEISRLIPKEDRAQTVIIIQVESFGSEEENVKALKFLKKAGYKAGICLNLPTPMERLTKEIVENADMVLLMTVPMGSGGQKYCDESTQRIMYFSQRFPKKPIEVDGGIDPQTINIAMKAGAKMAVVGSFITRNENPLKAIEELGRSLERSNPKTLTAASRNGIFQPS